jgi:hypothetical protein
MDIDAARKSKALPGNCHRCGKAGHWSKDCELRFDVRYMETSELEKAIEDKLAAKDVAREDPPPEAPQEAEEVITIEDFVSRSG